MPMHEYTKPIYQCDFCPEYRKQKRAMEKHEKRCRKNPNNQHACFDCKHLKVWEETFDRDDIWGATYKMKQFQCGISQRHLYTYKAEFSNIKDLFKDHFEDAEAIRMPLVCDDYEQSDGLWEG